MGPLMQTEIKGIEMTKLGKACADFVEQQGYVRDAKDKLVKIGERVCDAMHDAGKRMLTLTIDGEKFRFEIKDQQEKLIVNRQTKTNGEN